MATLSAIIPTRDRPDLLADALRSLMLQTRTDFEVVVVDDGSEADLEAVVHSVRGPVPIRYVRQEPAGLNVGRNHGAEVAKSDVLAYLDDDTIVDSGWADAMVHAFSDTRCAAVAGRIRLWFEGRPPDWLTPALRSYLSELDLGDSPRELLEELPYGANCAVTRGWWEKAGGFRVGLDRIGTSLVSNGDIEFFLKVRTEGGKIVYQPRASVLHRVPASRLTADFFHRRAYAQGVSDVLLQRAVDPTSSQRLGREMVRAARVAPVLAKGVANGSGTRNARCWLAYTRGRVAAIRGAP